MAPERDRLPRPPEPADARAQELEFLLRLNREADAFLSNCESEGLALDASSP